MIRQSLFFMGPRKVEVREEPLAPPGPGQVLVQTLISAISPGTELLIYRGQAPGDLAVDETIPALAGRFDFPLKYGYSAIGRVLALGEGVPEEWRGRLVFAFHPHESHFLANLEELLLPPPQLTPDAAVFFPNMETAVTLVMDGRPQLGEQVAVFGQGVVGLLLTGLLARLPLASLVTLDLHASRRDLSTAGGAHLSLDPTSPGALTQLLDGLSEGFYRGADLCYEVSGNPQALEQAIAATGFHGRVVIGSWYGLKKADLNLGGRFHRSRMRLISSQVSTVAPELSGRWSKFRRYLLAWRMLEEIDPTPLITHRFPLTQAAQAYELLDQNPAEALQVILTY
ncbi:MAG: oxidoreductase [Deltaproteobacteria bacterium]|nr:oxidoreductase [Deltaproteobacteria bacterium]